MTKFEYFLTLFFVALIIFFFAGLKTHHPKMELKKVDTSVTSFDAPSEYEPPNWLGAIN